MAPPLKVRSYKPVIAGVLILVAGFLALGMGLFYLALDVSSLEDVGVALPPEVSLEDLQDLMVICGGILVVSSFIAIVGGFFALKRKHFFAAIAGAVFGMVGIGFILGAILALIGLILVALSRHEFE
ncbi:MAG: hypothetical protein ABIE25_06810 [Thermoplasmatota archaeon]|nr:hypothetical protein [Candidatus Thermoplasmatota archaeon]MBU1913822.1 hypothetical protein [Candidatus Thermoplasmatota archaeon]